MQGPAVPAKLALPSLRYLSENGLAQNPPMGWASYNKFGLAVDDKLIRAVADSQVTTGMRDAGYVYLEIDDGWRLPGVEMGSAGGRESVAHTTYDIKDNWKSMSDIGFSRDGLESYVIE